MRTGPALAGVVVLGAALRFFPIWFGLPYAHARPDETEAIGYAVRILNGDPNPHFFHWPSLTFYAFAGLFTALRRLRAALEFADYAIAARAAVALGGTATLVLVARLTGRISDTGTAIVAAFLLAVAPLHVRESHFAMTDVLMTLFATGSLAVLASTDERSSWRRLAMAGLAGGLATSTKYSAAALAIAGLALPGAAWRGRAAFTLAFAGGFLAGTPYALADVATFRADVLFTQAHLAAGHVGEDVGPGWLYHLRASLPYGLGIPVFIAAIPGAVLLAIRHRRAAWLLASFAVPFFVAIGSGRTVFFRYVLPLVPLACVSAAVAIRALALWAAPRVRIRPPIATAVLAIVVAALPLANSLAMDRILARTDTRVLAAEWLAPRLRPGDTLHDSGGEYARLDLARTAFHEWRYDAATHQFVNAGTMIPDWLVVYDYAEGLRHYASTDARLHALAEARYTLAHEVIGMRDDRGSVFDREDAFFLPMHGFSGVERPGPNVRIYRNATARAGR